MYDFRLSRTIATAMTGSGKLKRNLKWLERALYLGGVALLAVFFYIRASGEGQREEGIKAFEAVIQKQQGTSVSSADSTPLATLPAPNQELWTDSRIAEYEASLNIESEPPLAVMKIDKLDIHVPVFNGTDDATLNRGVGRIIGTARVGDTGNLGIAGHRDSFFRGLKDIKVGDDIELKTVHGTVNYEVSSIVIVDPSDVTVLAPTAEKTITLVTCYPFYYVGHAPKRYIVKATAEHSLAKT
jgi:sortase A